MPILFDNEDEQFISEPVRGQAYHVLNSEESYAKLYAFLNGEAGVTPGELGLLMTLGRKVEPLRFDTAQRRTIHNLPFPRIPPRLASAYRRAVSRQALAVLCASGY